MVISGKHLATEWNTLSVFAVAAASAQIWKAALLWSLALVWALPFLSPHQRVMTLVHDWNMKVPSDSMPLLHQH